MSTFDPEAWVARAVTAGCDPKVFIQVDGTRCLNMYEVDLTCTLEERDAIAKDLNLGDYASKLRAVIDYLVGIDRVIDARMVGGR